MNLLTPLQISAIQPYDPLTIALIFVAAGAVIGALYFWREARGTHGADDRKSFAWLFGLLGFFVLLITAELYWADWAGFPAEAYTELFGTAAVLYAAVLLTGAFVLYMDIDPKPFAWLTAISGAVLLQGANAINAFQLTKGPLESTALWASLGIAGILLLPAAYVDEDNVWRTYIAYLIVLLLLIAAAISGVMGIEAHFSHIQSAATA